MLFKNKTIWVTGASSGIGEALTYELSKQGANLILSARNLEALNAVKNQCIEPKKVIVLPLDLSDLPSLKKKTNLAIKAFGQIDVMVNNGGISQRSLAKDTIIDVDKKIMDVNYLGTIALTKAVLPHFLERNSGHFVVTTSIVGKIGTPLRTSYAASKHALHGFFDSLRAEVYQNNIDVTLVCPGFVATNISKNALTGDGSAQQKMDKATANGIQPNRFAKLMVKAMAKKKPEVYIAGAKEKLGVFSKRYFPSFFRYMIRKLSVT